MKVKEQIEERLRDCKTPDEEYLEYLVPEARFAEEVRWATERQVLEWVLDIEQENKKGIDDFTKEYLWEVFVELNKRVDRWDDIYCKIAEKEFEQDKKNTVNNIILDHLIWSYQNGISDVLNDMSYILLNRPSPELHIRLTPLEETLKEFTEDDN